MDCPWIAFACMQAFSHILIFHRNICIRLNFKRNQIFFIHFRVMKERAILRSFPNPYINFPVIVSGFNYFILTDFSLNTLFHISFNFFFFIWSEIGIWLICSNRNVDNCYTNYLFRLIELTLIAVFFNKTNYNIIEWH